MRLVGTAMGILAGALALSAAAKAQDAAAVADIANGTVAVTAGAFYWIGQDLILTVESDGNYAMPGHDLNTLKDLFAALRACWTPPAADAAVTGMQLTIRLSFKRNGEMVAQPRQTYTLRGSSDEVRTRYRATVDAAMQRCLPLKVTAGLGGAIAGRPIAIRYVENREPVPVPPQAAPLPPRDPKLEALSF